MSEQGNQPAAVSYRRFFATVAVTAVVVAVIAIGVTALLVNIFERQREAEQPFLRVVEIDDYTDDPAVWGQNWPHQYDSYRRTVDMERTRHGGSEAIPRTPDEADPRSIVAQSRLEEDPRLVTLYAGYPFAEDFREARGHAYMLEDQIHTRRQEVAPQQGNCLHCHSSVYTAYLELGDGDIQQGFDVLNPMRYEEAVEYVEHPVSCIDCHDPDTMAPRITRPAFMRGISAYKESQGIEDYDVNRDASRQEMRSFVCAQCHVTYHFDAETRALTYPWDNGIRADEILQYYEDIEFTDWVHEKTGTNALKTQHPEFEMWNQGTHAAAGVSCADCHMPYERVGAMKVSSHNVRSPLLNVAASCQTCHNVSEEELLDRAHGIQDRHFELRNLAIDAVVDLIHELAVFREAGATDEELALAREQHRKAQFYVDFVESENSMGFHAAQESARVLTLAINHARFGQRALRDEASVELLERAREALLEAEPPRLPDEEDVEEAPEADGAEDGAGDEEATSESHARR